MVLRDTRRMKQVESTALAPTRQSVRSDISDDINFVDQAVQEIRREKVSGNQLLAEAKANSDRFEVEMGRLTVDLQQAFVDFGAEVSEAYNYQGSERFWSLFSGFSQMAKNKANALRMHRLLTQKLDSKIAEIQRLNMNVNRDFAKNESRYESDRQSYLAKQAQVISKLRENQPKLKEVVVEREDLESKTNALKSDLETGAISEDMRPAKEAELAQLQVNLHDAQLDEAHLLAVVKSAQEAIRILEENIGAAQKTIVAIRQMRISQSEKHNNLMEIFKNAMTAVVARASVEQFQVIDPAMNKTATEITRNNVLMAGAAMSTNIDRMKKAPIDPETLKELVGQMKGFVENWKQGIEELEDQVAEGARGVDEVQDQLGAQ